MAEGRGITRDVSSELDRLFRRESGKVVAALVRRFGPQHIDLIEDIVQDVLLQALTEWPSRGMPEKPLHWMMTAARNKAIDALRRRTFVMQHEEEIAEYLRSLASGFESIYSSDELLHDDTLRMIFACAHPDLARESQIVLMLRLLFGLPLPGIAQAFAVEEAAAAKRLVRAKQRFREAGLSLALEDPKEINARVPSVLNALYLTFALGYNAHHVPAKIREDVCDDALYLTRLLSDDTRIDDARLDALLALMLFQSGRMHNDGNQVAEAESYLLKSARGSTISTYHIEAAIAQQLAITDPDWAEVERLYDVLRLMVDRPDIIEALEHVRNFQPPRY